jgi:tetratricopeptide (TPR) repeat protein
MFKRALSCDPRNPKAYENLGKVYVARGATQKAIRYVQKSLSINPSQPQLEQILILLKKEILNKSRS